MVIGLAIIGIALYLIIDQNSSFMLTIGTTGPWVQYTTLALGIVVVIFASIGCCLVDSYSQCRLFFYGILLFFIGAIVVLAGAVAILYKDYSVTIAAASVGLTYELIPGGLADTQQYLASFQAGMYRACCVDANSAFTISRCEDVTNAAVCVFDDNSFKVGLASDSNTCSTITGMLQLCSQGTGSNSEFTGFTTEFANFMEQDVSPGGIAFVVFGGLLVIASLGSCVVSCNRRSSLPKPERQQASALAGNYKQPPATGGPVALV